MRWPAVLLVFPLAAVISRLMPDVLIAGTDATHTIDILLSLLLTRKIINAHPPIIRISAVAILVLLIYLTPKSIQWTVWDDKIGAVSRTPSPSVASSWFLQPIHSIRSYLFDTKAEKIIRQLKRTVDHTDPVVRNFAVRHSIRYFNDAYSTYGPLVRYVSLFKSINQQFKYVPDPVSAEYYATARETIENELAGDCDDYTILMIAVMTSLGARVRMVLLKDHVYPELYGGDPDAFKIFQTAMKQLFREENPKGLYYREENGQIWINLDYTARHPGGPYMEGEIIAIEPY
jgi:hypothetical protein